ncbi:hypothetical protein [Novosphingobium resinovorum]|uniref:Uncharacterized protein n=1 Tax=Novosphingobium resinovorum TaxID=158500 RepID=A0A1D8AEK0_9SPHN|nr:hypothetical protein [Novosphingobium resinovorum]AOR80481.1 hypothetical protein BES08_26855 [Novosphingobium resinovorum]
MEPFLDENPASGVQKVLAAHRVSCGAGPIGGVHIRHFFHVAVPGEIVAMKITRNMDAHLSECGALEK